jgi:phage baseplate assembly protein V
MARNLGETGYTKTPDNRFKSSIRIGIVAEVVPTATGANVRVIFPDLVDHNNQPLISKPIPVLQSAASKKQSFALPRLGTNVVVAKLPNGTADYMVLGSFYTSNNPPPVTDPNLDYTKYDDGSVIQFDAANGTLTWNLKGGITLECQGNIVIKSDAGTLTLQSSGLLNMVAPNIKLQGTVEIDGDITHTGGMTTSGVHTDANGVHT